MTHLWINLHADSNPDRRNEIATALERNIQNLQLDRIHCLGLGYGKLHGKVKIINGNERSTFGEFFRHIGGYPDDLHIIANSDIEITEAAVKLATKHLKPKEVWALSRWDNNEPPVKLIYRVSQDSWWFRGCPQIGFDFQIGRHGCDNRLAWELDRAGWRVSNPSLDVVTIHHHASDIRPTREQRDEHRIDGPHLAVEPTVLPKIAPDER